MANILIVGAAGQQGAEYFSILKNKHSLAVLDTNKSKLDSLYNENKFNSLEEALEKLEFKTAIVCVPHNAHFKITSELLKNNKNIIKEKPLAVTLEDIYKLKQITNKKLNIFTIVQRNFNFVFTNALANLHFLGKIYSYKYEYMLKVPSETTGWRANFECAKGGVLIDMGYHILDVILTFFGQVNKLDALASSLYNEKLEDSIHIIISHENNISGSIMINRHGSFKKESFEIYAENRTMVICPNKYSILDRNGNLLQEYSSYESSSSIKNRMLEHYLNSFGNLDYLQKHTEHHTKIVSMIDNLYKICRISQKLAA